MLQPYDYVMVVVLVASALWGAWKGVVWQIAALASVVVSAAVAIHCSPPLAHYFSSHEPWNRFAAMAAIYVATSLVIWLLFRLVSGAVNRLQLKEFDRQLGVLFGVAKGLLYCIVITFFAVTLSEAARQAVLQSRSGDIIARGIRNANPILPDDVRTWLGRYIDDLDEKLHPASQAAMAEGTAPLPSQSRGEAPTGLKTSPAAIR